MTGASGASSSNIDLISSLNACNPLHLQTNDNSSRSLINIKPTRSENYRVWATAMKIALQARNKIVFVDGSCVKAAYASSVPLTNQWERCIDVVLSWLLSSISDDLYPSQVYSENVAEIAKLTSLIGDKPGNGIHANMACIKWIIDSKANQHITSSTENMTDVVDIIDLNITAGHPNGTIDKIRKVGNLKLTNNIVLFDVLAIPEYCVLKKENVLGTGIEAGGLYVFNTENDTAEEQSFDDDQGSVQIGEENFPGGNVPENNNVPTHLFKTEKSSGL
ncbi:ribonuclease H-like domain-containing protein [Tanacetum coccineum]